MGEIEKQSDLDYNSSLVAFRIDNDSIWTVERVMNTYILHELHSTSSIAQNRKLESICSPVRI